MNDLATKTKEAFIESFQCKPDALYFAPGRVNLIGEHTDYNGGFVLPCAIDRGTYLAIKSRDDSRMSVIAHDIDSEKSEWDGRSPITPDIEHPWANYLRGVHNELTKLGHDNIRGMDVVASGNVPQGAGLSSSASFSVAFASALSGTNQLNLSATEIALLCQAAENNFAGCNCGIMDQLISAAGKEGHAVLIDCNDLSLRHVPMPSDLEVLIIDSKVKRGLVGSEYNTRRIQCEEAAQVMGIKSLRDATPELLKLFTAKLNPTTLRRATHIVTENTRTELAAEALRTSNAEQLSQLMKASHISMRDDFEITVPAVDLIVKIVDEIIGDRGGVRMTGGGFGGCVIALVPPQYIGAIKSKLNTDYTAQTGLTAEFHICKASRGAGLLEKFS
ncbi:galactokinase [Teredinibacter waterburyi]|uniref:galactokinase n=1 Tax=Teredinibacter waterburyi TaxID=1500538 RepID=UPI00165FA2BA|nr:galactokinase [Teredinibacter waterburyi]